VPTLRCRQSRDLRRNWKRRKANFHTEERNNVDVSFREVLVYGGGCHGDDMAVGQAQDIAPVNSGANPYTVVKDWAQLTIEKRPWGGSRRRRRPRR